MPSPKLIKNKQELKQALESLSSAHTKEDRTLLEDHIWVTIGINPNLIDQDSFNLAIENGSSRLVSAMLDKGKVDVNEVNPQGLLPLEAAAFNGNVKVAKVLLDKGANLVGYDREMNILDYAVIGGHLEMVQFLVGCGASVDKENSHHRTPIDYVSDSREILEYLAEQTGKSVDQFISEIRENPQTFAPLLGEVLDAETSSEQFQSIVKAVDQQLEQPREALVAAAESGDKKKFINVLRETIGAIAKALGKLGYNLTIRPISLIVGGVKQVITPKEANKASHAEKVQDSRNGRGEKSRYQ